MKLANLDLRNTTIFDLTSDKKIISDEFGVSMSKKEYAEIISIETRIKDLLDFADLTNNKELKTAVLKEFENELLVFGF